MSSAADPKTTEAWPPTSPSGLARILHENDRTAGEAIDEWIGCDWSLLSDSTRIRFLEQAEAAIMSGEFLPGAGWVEQFR